MSDFFVILVLKTVIYYSKLLGFQNFVCLKLEHYSSDTDFIDRHYLKDYSHFNFIFKVFVRSLR